MNPPRPMITLIVATGNAHKIEEIKSILGNDFQCLGLNEFPEAPSPIESGETFAANAVIKARSLAEWLAANETSRFADNASYVLADDSGLEVDALQGAPGVHSARFASNDTGAPGNSSDADNNAKLLRLLANVPNEERSGRFRCTLALLPLQGSEPMIFDGTCEGRLTNTASGSNGFGYDPLFVPIGHDRSFAELGEAVKNRLSHRARAVEKLKAYFEARN
jgi:XTP/dITP diphosphohydrolase